MFELPLQHPPRLGGGSRHPVGPATSRAPLENGYVGGDHRVGQKRRRPGWRTAARPISEEFTLASAAHSEMFTHSGASVILGRGLRFLDSTVRCSWRRAPHAMEDTCVSIPCGPRPIDSCEWPGWPRTGLTALHERRSATGPRPQQFSSEGSSALQRCSGTVSSGRLALTASQRRSPSLPTSRHESHCTAAATSLGGRK